MKSYKKIAQEQDKRVAEVSGLKIRPNSGAISGHKGDLGGSDIFIETKTKVTNNGFLSIDTDWLIKAKKQAQSMGKPIYGLVVSPGDGSDFFITNEDIIDNGSNASWACPDYWFTTKSFRLVVDDIVFKLYKKKLIRINTKVGLLVLMDLDTFLTQYRPNFR